MAVEVRWTLHSLEDIDNIAEFIAKQSLFYAQVQTERFFQRAIVLEQFPESGRIVPELNSPEIRELIEGNYRIIYKVVSIKRVDILTVYHSNRLLTGESI